MDEGFVFLEVGNVAVHVGAGRGGIHLLLGEGEGLQLLTVASVFESVGWLVGLPGMPWVYCAQAKCWPQTPPTTRTPIGAQVFLN